MNPKVSVIVPIYNSEKTLAECLGNLIYQTLPEIELILVDDCSTDGSYQIMKDCFTQFPNKVQLLSTPKNLGPGGARNLGLDAACGEYIGFVDSDDIVDATMFEKLYSTAVSGDYDMVDCGFFNEAENLCIVMTSDELSGTLDESMRQELIVSGGYLWTRIVRNTYFKQHPKLRFRNHDTLEDSEFLLYMLATIRSIGTVKEVLYHYRNNSSSMINTVEPEHFIEDILHAMDALYKKFNTLPNYRKLRDSVEYAILQLYSYGINFCLKNQELSGFDYKSRLQQLSRLKKSIIKGTYANRFVQNKLPPEDIACMMANDLGTLTNGL